MTALPRSGFSLDTLFTGWSDGKLRCHHCEDGEVWRNEGRMVPAHMHTHSHTRPSTYPLPLARQFLWKIDDAHSQKDGGVTDLVQVRMVASNFRTLCVLESAVFRGY